MVREIILDTETTGLFVKDGHRIIELAAIELNGTATGAIWHSLINPGRRIEEGATKVHGIEDWQVATAPRFGEVAEDFCKFVAGADLIAHNAPFDAGFVAMELNREGLSATWGRWIDTLAIARQRLPGKRHTLDALCKHFGVSLAARRLHGAILDCQLLAQVYIRLIGRVEQIEMAVETGDKVYLPGGHFFIIPPGPPVPHPGARGWNPGWASRAEIKAHKEFMKTIGNQS